MRHRRSIAALFLLAATLVGIPAFAQDVPEIIRGRITDDSSRGVVASVMVTRGPDRLTQQTTSDSTGRYSVRFEEGTGDYLVYVTAAGFNPVRRRVTRAT